MEPTEVENQAATGDADVLDATQLPPRERHQLIFERFDRLAVGESFILSNSHDPAPLRHQFAATHPNGFTWDYVESGPERWLIRIGKLESNEPPLPEEVPVAKLLCEARSFADDLAKQPSGAVWKLAEDHRQLDANLVHLPAGHRVDPHAEKALDVMLVVVSGAGVLEPDGGEPLELTAGRVIWMPHGSRRSLSAGDEGLLYLTVHKRRPGMTIQLIER